MAFPVNVAPTNVVASIILNLLVPVVDTTLPVKFPTKVAAIVPALKPPSLFLATTFPIMFDDVASTDHVAETLPSKSFPEMYVPFNNLFVVADLIVIFC